MENSEVFEILTKSFWLDCFGAFKEFDVFSNTKYIGLKGKVDFLIRKFMGVFYFQGACLLQSLSILENEGISAIFQKKDKKMFKNGKVSANLGKYIQNLKIFSKNQVIAWNNCSQ